MPDPRVGSFPIAAKIPSQASLKTSNDEWTVSEIQPKQSLPGYGSEERRRPLAVDGVDLFHGRCLAVAMARPFPSTMKLTRPLAWLLMGFNA